MLIQTVFKVCLLIKNVEFTPVSLNKYICEHITNFKCLNRSLMDSSGIIRYEKANVNHSITSKTII